MSDSQVLSQFSSPSVQTAWVDKDTLNFWGRGLNHARPPVLVGESYWTECHVPGRPGIGPTVRMGVRTRTARASGHAPRNFLESGSLEAIENSVAIHGEQPWSPGWRARFEISSSSNSKGNAHHYDAERTKRRLNCFHRIAPAQLGSPKSSCHHWAARPWSQSPAQAHAPRACSRASASGKRCSGGLARHRSTTRSRSSGIPGRTRDGGSTGSRAWAIRTAVLPLA